jgi:hypothetical protein
LRCVVQPAGAPAPLIGVGHPAGAAIGSVLLGAKLLKRRK